MSDIFHEVEEDLRRDKLNQLWTRYGTLFLTVAVLSVAATGGVVFWRQYTANQLQAAADAFDAASDKATSGDYDGALAAFGAISAPGGDGYATIALFREATLHVAKRDLQGAVAIYDKIAQTTGDAKLKAIARLRAAYLVADIEAPDVLKNRVADMTSDDNAWRFEAREIQAYADFRAGRMVDAAAAFDRIAADTAAAKGVKDRAAKFAVYIKGGGTLPAPPPPPAAAVPAPEAASPETAPAAAPAADPATKPATGQDR